MKFTPEGGRIELRAKQADGAVEISVSDTGIGIAPEDQATIFEEFRQVGGDYAHKKEGTGLGLTLAKKFVELHGGKIWVESEVGKGSTVHSSHCRYPLTRRFKVQRFNEFKGNFSNFASLAPWREKNPNRKRVTSRKGAKDAKVRTEFLQDRI